MLFKLKDITVFKICNIITTFIWYSLNAQIFCSKIIPPLRRPTSYSCSIFSKSNDYSGMRGGNKFASLSTLVLAFLYPVFLKTRNYSRELLIRWLLNSIKLLLRTTLKFETGIFYKATRLQGREYERSDRTSKRRSGNDYEEAESALQSSLIEYS